MRKVASRLCGYPQKLCRNRSISLRFRDKRVFAFNAEIQDGRQKWPGKSFLVKVASRLATYPADQKFCRNRSISLCFRDKRVFAFNRNSRWPPKVVGKRYLQKVTSRLHRYPVSQKFRQNRSISLRY